MGLVICTSDSLWDFLSVGSLAPKLYLEACFFVPVSSGWIIPIFTNSGIRNRFVQWHNFTHISVLERQLRGSLPPLSIINGLLYCNSIKTSNLLLFIYFYIVSCNLIELSHVGYKKDSKEYMSYGFIKRQPIKNSTKNAGMIWLHFSFKPPSPKKKKGNHN